MTTQFYVTLPSNSSWAFYGRQHPSNFTTKLESAVSVDPELWEVGLAEITYPATWHNVAPCTFTVGYPAHVSDPSLISVVVPMDGDRYISSHHFVRTLHRAVQSALPEEHGGKIHVRYDEVANSVRVSMDRYYTLQLPPEIAIPLGFGGRLRTVLRGGRPGEEPSVIGGIEGVEGPELRPKAETERYYTGPLLEGKFGVNVNRLNPDIYVYCDIVQHQRVGDTAAPLLRHLVHREKTESEFVVTAFNNIHYVDLLRGSFETIEIRMAHGTGQNISFQHGNAIVKLHFRRKGQAT